MRVAAHAPATLLLQVHWRSRYVHCWATPVISISPRPPIPPRPTPPRPYLIPPHSTRARASRDEQRASGGELLAIGTILECPFGSIPGMLGLGSGYVELTVQFIEDMQLGTMIEFSGSGNVSYAGSSYLSKLGVASVANLHQLSSINLHDSGPHRHPADSALASPIPPRPISAIAFNPTPAYPVSSPATLSHTRRTNRQASVGCVE